VSQVSEPNYLVSPRADFWLLGGASVVAWSLLTVANELGPSRDFLAAARGDVFLWVLALFSYPHFAASQWLCYSREKAFLRKNWFELFAVPAVLACVLAVIWWNYERFGMFGLRCFLTAFLILSGWHFAMQAFGSSVVSFHYDGRRLAPEQRSALKTSLLALWVYFSISRLGSPADREFFGVAAFSLPVPRWAGVLLALGLAALTLRAFFLLVVRPWRDGAGLPSGRAIVPWLALFLWWLPSLRSIDFFLYGIPLFHGLQQYAFTYRFERGRGSNHLKIVLLAAGLCAFGFTLHRALPMALDSTRLCPLPNYFFLCATFLINIHHYFLDRATFRLSDAETRRILMSPPERARSPEIAAASSVPSRRSATSSI
jgi:hypothetical protein